jgi:hypothetical protein
MPADPHKKGPGRLQLLLIAAVFAGPLALAAWMYYSGSSLAPASGTNKGALLLPIVNLRAEMPQSDLHELAPDQWLMLYANLAGCDEACRDALVRLRQSRLMLGKDMPRVVRVFLHGDSAPDTVSLEQQHAGLKTITDKGLSALLEDKQPADLQSGGCYLIDPLGNLVMYFPPGLKPKDMVGDIKHLLRLSHIG